MEEKIPSKPHPLRSPVNVQPSLFRAFTIPSLPMAVDKSTDKCSKHYTKSPFKLRLTVSPKGSAWQLEDEDEDVTSSVNGTPFGLTGTQLYYTREMNHSKEFKTSVEFHTEERVTHHFSCEEVSEMKETVTRRSQKGFAKLVRRLSQKLDTKLVEETVPTLATSNRCRSQSLENIAINMEFDEETTSLTAMVSPSPSSGMVPLNRTMSLNRGRRAAFVESEPIIQNLKDFKERTRKKKNDVEELFYAVEHQDLNELRSIVEANEVDVNSVNRDGFTPLDVAVLTNAVDVAKMLLQHGAKQNPKSNMQSTEKNIKMLAEEAEQKVEDLTVTVVNNVHPGSSEFKEIEKQLRDWEWRHNVLIQMKKGLKCLDVPESPSGVYLSAASESSLLVRIAVPKSEDGAIVTKYKVQWSKSEEFKKVEGESLVYDLRRLQHIIVGLKKSVAYYVRVSAGNIKGFGPWQPSSPPFSIPSSWHEWDDSKPRFEGRLDVIKSLFKRVHESLQCHKQHSPSECDARSRSASLTNDKAHSPKLSPRPLRKEYSMNYNIFSPKITRKETVKKNFTRYTNMIFHLSSKFVKQLKRGIYLACLICNSDGRVLVTLDDQMPVVEVDDTFPSSFQADLHWFMKVACTWKDVHVLHQESERSMSSTAVIFRYKLLQAAETLQNALGVQDLGQLYPEVIKNGNGSTIILSVGNFQGTTNMRSRLVNLKWFPLSKLQKKLFSSQNNDSTFIAPDRLFLTMEKKIQYNQRSREPLRRGLYLGYLKLRTFVDAIHVVVHEDCPNALPHLRIRENPNISREEWEILQNLEEDENHLQASKTAVAFKKLLGETAKLLLSTIGVQEQEYPLHRFYDQEVVELDQDVTFLILLPPPQDVCSPPGAPDIFTDKKGYTSLSIQTFEMIHMYTYQKDFICQYSRLSSILDMEIVLNQHALREAFSNSEYQAAKEQQTKLLKFQKELDETWKGMRWLLDALHYARDRQLCGGIPVRRVLEDSIDKPPKPNGLVRDKEILHTISSSDEDADNVIRVFPAFETGMAFGTGIKLRITADTTANEIVRLVVRELNDLKSDKNHTHNTSNDCQVDKFCLVAVVGPKELLMKDDFKLLSLENPWVRGKLFVRLKSEATASSAITHTSSV